MPSVTAEAPILPSRPNLPSLRTYSSADSGNATPFADLLDSQAPAPEPPPPPQTVRSPDRADQPKPADNNNADAKPAADDTDAKSAQGGQGTQGTQDTQQTQGSKDTKPITTCSRCTQDTQQTQGSKDAKSATDGSGDGKDAKDAKDGKAADATKDAKDAKGLKAAGGKPKSDADQAALNAIVGDATTPAVTAPQATAVAATPTLALATAGPKGGTPEADALAALQAAAGQGPRTTSDAATKPGQTQAGDKPVDASAKGTATAAKGAATAAPQAAVPEIEAGKDGQPHSDGSANGNGDKALSEFHRTAAELLSKVDVNAPAPSNGDAASAAKAGTDAVQILGAATPVNAAGPASVVAATAIAAPAPAQAPAAAVPLSGLAVEIVTQADAGRNHFEIRLDPPDLGRINVKLNVDNNGNVTTHLVVDRADTLDLLKRDASSLERALQQAGLKTSDNALDFSLRQHSFAQNDTPEQSGTQMVVPEDDPAPLEALRQGYGRLLGLSGGLDIRV